MEFNNKEEIARLAITFLSGESSPEDTLRLKEWVEQSPANKLFYQQIKNIWDFTQAKSETKSISVNDALESVLSKLETKTKRSFNIVPFMQKAAAILLIPITLASVFWISRLHQKANIPATYNQVYAAFGTRSAITLADGTKVWLNAGSSLRYPDKFESDKRSVFLSGEAYFEVKSDKAHPFIVQNKQLQVVATGTKFNVCAFNSEKNASVTLLEGKVTVSSSKKMEQKIELKPNENLVFDTASLHMEVTPAADTYRFIAWKDGKLVFRNDPLSVVVKKISQYYNVDIELQGKKLQEYRYRATFRDESLDDILKLLKLSSPVNYKELPRNPNADGSFPQKKILIYPAE